MLTLQSPKLGVLFFNGNALRYYPKKKKKEEKCVSEQNVYPALFVLIQSRFSLRFSKCNASRKQSFSFRCLEWRLLVSSSLRDSASLKGVLCSSLVHDSGLLPFCRWQACMIANQHFGMRVEVKGYCKLQKQTGASNVMGQRGCKVMYKAGRKFYL